MKTYLFIFAVFSSCHLFAQANQNFAVKTKKTDCEQLKLLATAEIQRRLITEEAIFSFVQDFRLPGSQQLKWAKYFSCNGKSGYITLLYQKDTLYFQDVNISQWKEFLSSKNPNETFSELKNLLHPLRQP